MKLTEQMEGTTVGHLAAFLAHAITNGVPLDAQIEMQRNRGSDITAITIDLPLPGFTSPQVASAALTGTKAPSRPRGGREAAVQPALRQSDSASPSPSE